MYHPYSHSCHKEEFKVFLLVLDCYTCSRKYMAPFYYLDILLWDHIHNMDYFVCFLKKRRKMVLLSPFSFLEILKVALWIIVTVSYRFLFYETSYSTLVYIPWFKSHFCHSLQCLFKAKSG